MSCICWSLSQHKHQRWYGHMTAEHGMSCSITTLWPPLRWLAGLSGSPDTLTVARAHSFSPCIGPGFSARMCYRSDTRTQVPGSGAHPNASGMDFWLSAAEFISVSLKSALLVNYSCQLSCPSFHKHGCCGCCCCCCYTTQGSTSSWCKSS